MTVDVDETLLDLAAAVRRHAETIQRHDHGLAELRAVFETLITILRARGDLEVGHVRLLAKLREHARGAGKPHIELGTHPDKYAAVNSEVDCGARMHICHGRCCSFNIRLSQQDLDEGVLRFRSDEPYFLAQTSEGYCVHQQRESGFCGTYANRPAPCRTYDCRNDRRIWIDFDAMVPAPMPTGLVTIRRKARRQEP